MKHIRFIEKILGMKIHKYKNIIQKVRSLNSIVQTLELMWNS
jgi:hypothetical protein